MAGSSKYLSRREAIRAGIAAGVGLAVGRIPLRAEDLASPVRALQLPLFTKAIPSSGERIPVIGVGTRSYSPNTPEENARMCNVLRTLSEKGGKVVDTARGYGRSEETIGQCLKEIGNRDKLFVATKFSLGGGRGGRGGAAPADPKAGLELAFTRLGVDKIDLMMVHNLGGTDQLLPIMKELKQAGRFRYIGVSTSSDNQYEPMMALLRQEQLDFIQVDYAINNRSAEQGVLPLAQERGAAVLVNLPLGRTSVFDLVSGKQLPPFAAEIDCTTWAQFFLKYVVSHPAVTCAIPGTTNPDHMAENLGATHGRMPDAAMRKRMEEFVTSL
jgi:aryl-alcohol dehydrogenase-like predicted oxidoreductase